MIASAAAIFLCTGELLKLLNLFAAHGIGVIPYKGPTFGSCRLGNLALREFTDLDILVQTECATGRRIAQGSGLIRAVQLERAGGRLPLS